MTGSRTALRRFRTGSFFSLGRGASRRRQRSWNRPLETLENRQMLHAEPIVSEFMAINTSTLQDQDGDFSEWLELGNRGEDPIDLGGHYLTNDAADLDRWRIPNGTVLDPGEYLVVFASGKNRAVAGSQLHTNFTLHDGGAGSFLALVGDEWDVGRQLVFELSDAGGGSFLWAAATKCRHHVFRSGRSGQLSGSRRGR